MVFSINQSNYFIANHIENFPQEIIVRILIEVFSSGIDNYIQCCLVSKKFYKICCSDQLWKLITSKQLEIENSSFWNNELKFNRSMDPKFNSLHCYVAHEINLLQFFKLPDITKDLIQESRRKNYIDAIKEIGSQHLPNHAPLVKGLDDYARPFLVCRCIDRSKNPPQKIIVTLFHECLNSEQWCYWTDSKEPIFSNEKLGPQDKRRLGSLIKHEPLGFYSSGLDNQEKNLTKDGKSILELE